MEGFGKKTEAEPTLAHFALSALVLKSKKYLRISEKIFKKTEAKPTLGHFALSALVSFIANINISGKEKHIGFNGKLQVRSGLAEEWINQNHDGLAQKAGCPQHKLNEVFIEHIIHLAICELYILGPLPYNL